MIAEDYSPIKGTTIKLVSLTGQLIQYLRNSDTTGEILKCEVEAIKNGGVDVITFSVDRRTNIPVFPGMFVEVFKDGEKFAIGYSNTIPQPQSAEAELELVCLGFMHKLDEAVVNKTYASITLKNIIAELQADLNSVDILYDASKIDLPDTTITELEFDDKPITDIMETILQVANVDFLNYQYRWFIDNDKTLNFELMSNDPERTLFEGFNYQYPEIEDDENDIVNKIYAYKTDSVDTSEVVFVSTYEDTDSQGKYGVRDRKIVFPDSIDNTTLESYCTGILEENKTPQTKALLKDLEGIDFPFSFYKLSDRIDDYWQLMSECDSFDGWDLSGVSNTSVTLSDEQVLTGRQSIKCDTLNGSLGEFIEFNLDTPIYGPSLFRFYLFLEESMNLEITLIGTDDVEYSFKLGTGDINIKVNQTLLIEKNLEVNDGTLHGVQVSVQVAYFNDWLKIEVQVSSFAIKSARVTFKTDADSTVYLDRLELKARSYLTNKLMLEKITYKLNKDYALSEAEFGDKFPNLHDTIKEKVKEGDIALSIFAKQ